MRSRRNSSKRRRRKMKIHILSLTCLLLTCCFAITVTAKQQPQPLPPPAPRLQKQKQDIVVQIYETEVWNGNSWVASETSRWTTIENKKCVPPPSMEAPSRYEWSDGWKIVTTNRDAMGWEYVWHKSQRPCKRRTWLRTAKPLETITTTRPPRKQRRSKQLVILRDLKNDFNFKGFGWTLYKSLLFKESCGVAIRLPLSTNFDWCDRHPAWPSIATSVALFYPCQAVVFCNMSINIEWLKWRFALVVMRLQQVLGTTAWLTALLVTLPLWLVFPVYKKFLFSHKPAIDPPPPPQYSLELQERLGMSVSWRVSTKRGYEYRVSYWYVCLPTLLYCGRLVMHPFKILTKLMAKKKDKVSFKNSPLSNWLRQHTGSCGISTGGPTPDFPHFSLSALMSLSGFYYGKKQPQQQTRNAALDLDEFEDEPPRRSLLNNREEEQGESLLSPSVVANNSTSSETGSSGMRIASWFILQRLVQEMFYLIQNNILKAYTT